MNQLMIDIETLSTSKNAAIVSIGAVFFNIETGELGRHFYQLVSQKSCVDLGLDVNAETLAWWQKQADEVRIALNSIHGVHLAVALYNLNRFITSECDDKAVVWGNGPSFDCAILATAFNAVDMKLPWRYSNERCVRTMVDLGRTLLKMDPKHQRMIGTAHNALADAEHQAKYVSEIYRGLVAFGAKEVVAA